MKRSQLDKNYAIIARLLLGGFFVYTGLDNLLNLFITSEKLGFEGALPLVVSAAVFKITLGLAVMLRYHTRYAAFGLIIYTLTSTFLLYGPLAWSENELYKFIFFRNLAIVGGLLFVSSHSRSWKDWNEEFISKSEQELLHQHPHDTPHPLK